MQLKAGACLAAAGGNLGEVGGSVSFSLLLGGLRLLRALRLLPLLRAQR